MLVDRVETDETNRTFLIFRDRVLSEVVDRSYSSLTQNHDTLHQCVIRAKTIILIFIGQYSCCKTKTAATLNHPLRQTVCLSIYLVSFYPSIYLSATRITEILGCFF